MRAVLLLNVFLAHEARAEAVSIYVSAEHGSDSNSGTNPSAPLRTLATALLDAQKLKASKLLISGTFHLNETLILSQVHSGLTVDQWRGQAAAVLSGGESIPSTAWHQLSDKVWSTRISQAAAQALASKGNGRIFVNGAARSIIRTKTMYWDEPLGNRGFTMSTEDLDSSWNLDKEHVSQWRVAAFHSWTKAYHSVSEVDATTRTIRFGEPATFAYGGYTYCSKRRYYIEGIPELPLTAGHWRLKLGSSSAVAELHYAPLPNEIMSGVSVVVPILETIIRVQSGRSITLQNFALEHSSSGDCSDRSGFNACDRDGALMATDALTAVNSESLHLRSLIIRNAGGTGILASLCPDLVIEGVGIVSTAANGIRVYKSPRALVNNSIIKGYGARFPAGEGINLASSPNGTVSHSDICCGFYAGISGGGVNDTAAYSTYAFNDVHDIGSEADDGICDFSGYHGANGGSILPIFITSNIFRNITAYANGGGGVYMDVSSTGYQVSGNLVHDVSASPIIWNINPGVMPREGGVPTRITNNVFIANRDNNYSRTNAARANHFWGQGNPVFQWTGHTSAELERNVIVVSAERSPSRGEWFGGRPCAKDNGESSKCTWDYEDNFKLLNSRNNVWHNASSVDGSGSSTFPGGCNSTGSESWKKWGADCVCRSWSQWQNMGQEASSIWIDPKFNGPLKLVSEPKALALGIEPLGELAKAGADWKLAAAEDQSPVVLI